RRRVIDLFECHVAQIAFMLWHWSPRYGLMPIKYMTRLLYITPFVTQ
ncbi:MAG: hypothetical protein ACI9Y1_002491, partial [Lentisphaeria bacterium]